ncbi:hypothetical protein TELCIR_13763 [Teladorsagia circumcincta]|uniref:Uncharacterized protein n=1 Tax=Teladorsagia circumcincta TaxID=45464 RepID=A0A2G9U348_TELCI|nr:hypothetical protein TELCIR_13763 [Teladorsagia circumcincta]
MEQRVSVTGAGMRTRGRRMCSTTVPTDWKFDCG